MASCENTSRDITPHDKAILNRIFNPNLPYTEYDDEEIADETEDEEETENIKAAKVLELRGVQAAESGDIDGAIEFFNQAIEADSNWASSYNNRAQAYRLKGQVQDAMDDLNKAIELSHGKGKAASQAYTQRGLVYKLEGRDDEALEDFKCGAKLGNQFAKSMCIELNPYAALCNNMLAEVFDKIRRGEEEF